jgi:hypothetical protein
VPLVRCLHQTWITYGQDQRRRIWRKPEDLTRDNLVCAVSRIGNDYYWASRENTELVIEGAFEDLVIKPSFESESFKFQPFTRFLVTMLSSFTCLHSRTSNGESF